ncbi:MULTISPECIES: TIGR03118 family protein [unclassified Caballeronia]|uniref:TIGR03118 family protein n=1 Tax=unclassified Caballeronia TaxID=2646786 RepID=UPI0020295C48|nr:MULTISPECIES: TIGR03118 family protein [unclassified Caballeronia]MDR5764387.1 TIGR03118 family protein [Caballeronia sp. LZ028]
MQTGLLRRLVVCAAAVVSLAGIASCGGGSDDNMPTATRFKMSIVVSDGAVSAPHTDPNLKNGWGVAFNPNGFVWVADNGTQTATLYDGNGVVQSLVVSIPPSASGPAKPTGIVFNKGPDLTLSRNGKSGVAAFVFAGEGGSITAWAPAVDMTHAFTAVDSSASGAIYKGLAIATTSTGAHRLYATDFHNNKVDVFDGTFTKIAVPGGFRDAQIPAGFAPFGIQTIVSKIFVTYAKQDGDAEDDVPGAGLGFVDVFDIDGNLTQRFAANGPLNAPWGIAQAPGNFGTFSNDILIGNFGDGAINAFDPNTGAFVGALTDTGGAPLVQHGLWGIAFGNNLNAQPSNTLFFAAGPNDEANGVYGRIDMQ